MTVAVPTGLKYTKLRDDGGHEYEVSFDNSAPAMFAFSKRHLDNFGMDNPQTTTSVDADANQSLIKAVQDFDKAGHILMFEHGSVTAEPPLTVPPPMRPIELQYEQTANDGKPQIILLMQHEDTIKKYAFEVSPRPGVAVRYPHELYTDLGGCIDLAKPLIDSIRNFFIAGRPDLKNAG